MTQSRFIIDFIDYMTNIKKSSGNTLSAYKRDLGAFDDYMKSSEVPLDKVSSLDIISYQKKLTKKGFSASSVSRAMSSIRSFYKYLFVSNLISDNPTRDIKTEKVKKKQIEVLTEEEIELLLAQPDIKSVKGIRDKAMLEVMYATGIKVSELVSLSLKDVNLQLGYINCTGERERTIFLYPAAIKALKEYLDSSRRVLDSSKSQALFVNINGDELTRQGLWKILKGYAIDAGIKKTITPHTLRNSFATHLLENGADIHDIKEILGHSDIASTQVYANYIKSRIKDSYLKFHPRA